MQPKEADKCILLTDSKARNVKSTQAVIPYRCLSVNPPLQTWQGHTRMILEILVLPKAFYTSSTDLTVRSWVYEFEDATNIFKQHQHSVGAISVVGDTCKLGQSHSGKTSGS